MDQSPLKMQNTAEPAKLEAFDAHKQVEGVESRDRGDSLEFGGNPGSGEDSGDEEMVRRQTMQSALTDNDESVVERVIDDES
jgi:hypothetical protein